jgi:hypothetical protein
MEGERLRSVLREYRRYERSRLILTTRSHAVWAKLEGERLADGYCSCRSFGLGGPS